MKKKIMIVLIVVAAIILLLAIWFNIPYSPVKTQFKTDVEARTQKVAAVASEKYTADDFKDFPPTIQKYLELNGYIGAKRHAVLSMEYNDVDFGLGVIREVYGHLVVLEGAAAYGKGGISGVDTVGGSPFHGGIFQF